MRTIVTAMLAATCLTSGCREGSSPAAPVTTVNVDLENSDLFVGETTVATALLRDADEHSLTGRPVTWTSSDPTVATIVGNGATAAIVAVSPGTTEISASSEGVTGVASLRVTTTAFVQIAVGNGHTCGRTSSGSLWCWGENGAGQLGDGTETNRSQPTQVVGGLTFVEVAAGVAHTCGRTASASVYCWGSNFFRQLGDGSDISSPTPVRVSGTVSLHAISAGPFLTCGLSSAGDVYCWGASMFALDAGPLASPTLVHGGGNFVELRLFGEHSCARTSTNTFCWGQNSLGQLGDGTMTSRVNPAPVLGAPEFVRLAGPYGPASCGLTAAGQLWCWGTFRLPDGNRVNPLVPTPVTGVPELRDIAMSYDSACVLTLDGRVLCWGSNSNGQLGDGTTIDRPSVGPVSGDMQFAQLASGYLHMCGLTLQGVAVCWGRNAFGQLGDGTFTDRSTPTRVK